MERSILTQLKVVELRDLLKKKGFAVKGTKDNLINRLLESGSTSKGKVAESTSSKSSAAQDEEKALKKPEVAWTMMAEWGYGGGDGFHGYQEPEKKIVGIFSSREKAISKVNMVTWSTTVLLLGGRPPLARFVLPVLPRDILSSLKSSFHFKICICFFVTLD